MLLDNALTLNGLRIHPGEWVLTRLVISRLPSGTVLLMAGMHGDEVNSIETIWRLIRRDLLQPTCGTVIAIPILNIYGFLNFSREVPDGKDVNRSFPGHPRGSLASRVAHRFMREVMPLVDYGIDFHTGGKARANHSQLRCLLGQEPAIDALAAAFAAPFTLHSRLRAGSLRATAHALGKPIIVYETGESLRLDEPGIEEAVAGMLRVLHHLGMGSEGFTPARPNVVCYRHRWLRARYAGLFRAPRSAGRLRGGGSDLRLHRGPLRRAGRAPRIAAQRLRYWSQLHARRESGRCPAAPSHAGVGIE